MVLVTGGTGFIGTNLVAALIDQGSRVRVPIHQRALPFHQKDVEVVTGNLMDPEDCLRVCEGVDYVFHAAGAVGAAGITAISAFSGITANLILTARILEAAWATRVKRILIFSSSTVYPAVDHPAVEEEMWSGAPHETYFGYGWMRRYLELLSQFAASKSEMGIAICRPTAVYGRYDNFDPNTGHVIPALILRALAKEDPFRVWGTGEEIRDFLHVSDLVRGCLLLLEKHAVCDPINIGSGQGVTIKEVVSLILNAVGHENSKVIYDATKPTTIPKRIVDITKAKKLLHYRPTISIRDGIEDTIKWYITNNGSN